MTSHKKSMQYSEDYYSRRHERTALSARIILQQVLSLWPEIHSAIDFGCGVGTWLETLGQLTELTNYRGYDGSWIDKKHLRIPVELFDEIDFENAITVTASYDLAISLEVAEHIEEKHADFLIDNLASSSDLVLFSAAVPGQRGRGHVNEQWPVYWSQKFEERGFICYDCIRRSIWNEARIPYWYRQNLLVFVNGKRHDLQPAAIEPCEPLAFIHPEMLDTRLKDFEEKLLRNYSLRGSLRQLRTSIFKKLRRK
jgi:hypothetical protein